MRKRRRVVITGLGVVAPNGIGKQAFWDSLVAGKSGIDWISAFDPSPYPCKVAAEVRDSTGRADLFSDLSEGHEPVSTPLFGLKGFRSNDTREKYTMAVELPATDDASRLAAENLPCASPRKTSDNVVQLDQIHSLPLCADVHR